MAENLVKVEDDVDISGRRGHAAVVSPRDPLVALATEVLRVQSEVGVAELVVGELAETAAQPTVADRAVVREVVEVHLGASAITLATVVRHHAVYSTHTHTHTQHKHLLSVSQEDASDGN